MRICFTLKKKKKEGKKKNYKFRHTVFSPLKYSFSNIFFLCLYNYLKESPSGEFINVVNADGGVDAPLLVEADLEPSVPQDKLTV